MGEALSILALLAAGGALIAKIVSANRRAARTRKRAEEERERRVRNENELRERVERVKKSRGPLELSRRAIADDPSGAAKTLSRMMRQKDE